MKTSTLVKRILACAVVVSIGCGVVLAGPQSGASDSEGSLAALTAEVRLLRLSVEKSAETQTQIQAMTVYLSAQQSRLIQASARADALRKDLDAAHGESVHWTDTVSMWEKALAMPLAAPSSNTPTREQLEAELSGAKRNLARATATGVALQNRESEATAAVQTELGQWTDMIARLEQLTRR